MRLSTKHLHFVIPALLCTFAGSYPTVLFADDATPALATTGTAADPAGPFTLAYKFTVGQVHRYSVAIDVIEKMISGPPTTPINIHVDLTTTQTIDSVSATDGAATERYQVTATGATMNGQPIALSSVKSFVPSEMTLVLSPVGKIVASNSAPGKATVPGFVNPNALGLLPLLSTDPVTADEAWTDHVPLPSIGVVMDDHVTLKGVSNNDGTQIAQIESKYTSAQPFNAGTQMGQAKNSGPSISGDYLTKFDINAGAVTSSIGRMTRTETGTANNGGQGAATETIQTEVRTQMTLLKP